MNRATDDRVLVCALAAADDGSWGAAAHRAVTELRGPTFHAEFRDEMPQRLDGEWNLVVGHGMEFAAPIERLAMLHPGTRFVLTDDPGPDERLCLPNLRYVDWRWDEGAFLAGVLASHLSTSGTVGILGGNPCNTQSMVQTAFIRGARFDHADTIALTVQTGSFHDEQRGYRLANALFDEGVDVLLHTADSCGRGAIEAARDRGRTMVGFLNDGDRLHDCVRAFIATDVQGAMLNLLSTITRGSPVGGVTRFGLSSGYQRFDLKPGIPAAVRGRIEELSTMMTTTGLSLQGC